MPVDTDEPEDNTETVFMPSRPPTTGPEPVATPAAATTPPPPGRVSVGDVLNGIYEVKRLIAGHGIERTSFGALTDASNARAAA